MSSTDRQTARQVVRLAQEISTDIGKLRRLGPVARDRHIGAVR